MDLEEMSLALFVIYALIAIAVATPIHDCGVLDQPFTTYELVNDIAINNLSYGFVCFNIKGNGITLDGNGFQLSSASGEMLPAVGVQYSGTGNTVTNLRVSNFRTGIHANGKFGKVHGNTITRAVSGIDVTATNNDISNNIIRNFNSDSESASGIYVYFPAIVPVDSSVKITNNVISDIQGDSFVLGVSVYYATSVNIANNQIFNLHGGISNEEISIIDGEATLVDNVFTASEGYATTATTVLLSALAVAASFVYFRSSSAPSSAFPASSSAFPAPVPIFKELSAEKQKEIEKEMMKQEGTGLPFKRHALSFAVGSSPGMGR